MTEEMYHGLSPFETFIMNDKTAKKPSGAAIAGLVLGSVGTAAAIGSWIFGPVFATAKSNGVAAVVAANQAANNQAMSYIASVLATERAERVAQGTTISQTITDSISGQQSSTLTAQQASELSSFQNLQNTLLTDAVTGRSSLNPTPVSLYSAPAPCNCPGCGN